MNATDGAQARATPGNLPRVGQGSLTEQTTQALLEAILDRRFEGNRLPNEPDLADQMGVSRTTIRAALQSLDRFGVISRVPGRGTQLRAHIGRESMLLHRVIGIRGMLESLYDDVVVDQTFTIRDQPSALCRAALGLSEDTRILLNDKTYLVDGKPAVHLLQEVPLRFMDSGQADGLVSGAIAPPTSFFEFSRSWPGREIDHSVVELVPQITSVEGPDPTISLPVATPYLELREVHYSDLNEAVAYARESFVDAFARLRLVRT